MLLPHQFIASIQPLLQTETELFCASLEKNAPVSIRLNPNKLRRNPLLFTQPVEPVAWSKWGYLLNRRPSFTFDPLFHAGYYYVQEAASMVVEHIVRQLVQEPAVCLDVCAAPGGKSLSLLSALPEGSLLVSNEIIRQRANVLAETITKFGNPNTIVTHNAPNDFAVFPHLFDVVLVDAPCSGEGMFRKDEVALREWSPQNVQMCAVRQQDILRGVWQALKPGGLLIYSTCTYNTLENEENTRWIARELGAEFVKVSVEGEWGISPAFDSETEGCRFFPHKTNGEGFFVSVLRKTSGEEAAVYRQKSNHKNNHSPFIKDVSLYAGFLQHPELFDVIDDDNRVFALPKPHSPLMLLFRQRLKTIAAGIEIGERKGKDFIPAQALAMSAGLHPDAFPRYPLSHAQAIAYLSNQAIVLSDAPKGFVLLTFKNEPLGFVKNIGNRANNLYPQEWRIRSGYLPECLPDILDATNTLP